MGVRWRGQGVQKALISCSVNSNGIAFIRNFFKYKRARTLAVMSCSRSETHKLIQTLAVPGDFYVTSPDPMESSQTFLHAIMKRSLSTYGVFLDYDCKTNHEILFQCSESLLLNVSFKWLVWSSSAFPRLVVEHLKLQYDSDFHWAYPENAEAKAITIMDLYKLNHTLTVNATFAGHWDIINGLNYTLTDYVIRRRQNMTGALFRATIVTSNMPTDNLEEDLLNPKYYQVDQMATYNYRCFLDLKQLFNFTPELHHTSTFGHIVEEEIEPSGMALQLLNKEVDYSINSYIFNQLRTQATNYLAIDTWDFEISTIFRHPPVTYKWGALLRPFEPSLWIGCGIIWLIMLVTLRFISFFEAKYHDNEAEEAWTWSDVFVIITGALSQQGSTMDSEWMTGRIVFLNTHILALMMNGYYGAFIVSSLLSAPEHNIKTPQDILESNLAFGAEDIYYYHPYFELSTDPIVQEIYRKKMAPPNKGYYSLEEGLKKMQCERFAFHTQPINLYDKIENEFSDHEKCDLTTINIFPVEKGYIVVPYGSPHKEMVTFAYRKMIESGLIDYRNKHWRPRKPQCDIGDQIRPVTMNTVCFAMWLMVSGYLCSLFILLLEIIAHLNCLRKLSKEGKKNIQLAALKKTTNNVLPDIRPSELNCN